MIMSSRQPLRLETGNSGDELRPLEPRVTFTASGPLGLRVQGRCRELACCEQDGALVFSVPLHNLKTGISMRDHAMHELLCTRRYPTVELRVPRSGLTLPGGKGPVEGTCKATLVLRGLSGPLEVSYQIKRVGSMLEVTGATRIRVDLWGIKLPTHMGFGLKTQVPVKVVFKVPAASFAL